VPTGFGPVVVVGVLVREKLDGMFSDTIVGATNRFWTVVVAFVVWEIWGWGNGAIF
jgi:hypothetical protein